MHDNVRILRIRKTDADYHEKTNREPRIPNNLPSLPYTCVDPTCPHPDALGVAEDDCMVRLTPSSTGYQASIIDDYGMIIDVIRDYDAVRCLQKVHESYPTARYGDPE